MNWQTSGPPLDREIEFETDLREVRCGALTRAGSFGMGANARNAAERSRDQYMMKGGPLEMFEVLRWREIT